MVISFTFFFKVNPQNFDTFLSGIKNLNNILVLSPKVLYKVKGGPGFFISTKICMSEIFLTEFDFFYIDLSDRDRGKI